MAKARAEKERHPRATMGPRLNGSTPKWTPAKGKANIWPGSKPGAHTAHGQICICKTRNIDHCWTHAQSVFARGSDDSDIMNGRWSCYTIALRSTISTAWMFIDSATV
eukprot:1208323-Pyramimonas_sp.AAC.1